mmetsp:Transcript_75073/g.207078  ORF Transcript_75073/g.207078 Transcript_75073/m.207078 type:complete len:188 (-) Transcript_75073:91-654(-)
MDFCGERCSEASEEKEIECLSMDSSVKREITHPLGQMGGFGKPVHEADPGKGQPPRPTSSAQRGRTAHIVHPAHTATSSLPAAEPTQQSLSPLDFKEVEELRHLRFLTPSLQRQNAHLNLQVQQLRERLTMVENDLAQTEQLQAVAEEQALECSKQAQHTDIDMRIFSRFEAPVMAEPFASPLPRCL